MTRGRKSLLDEIGFCWDVGESAWQENYAILMACWKIAGNCMVKNDELDDDNKLYRWMLQQRNDLKKGKLTVDRKELLDEIELCWDVQEHEWEHSFKLLKEFAEREGHCDVLKKHVEDGKPLGTWLGTQRKLQKKGTLEKSRQERLEKLGVMWNLQEMTNDMSWMNKYNLLVKFKEREGHCKVPQGHKEGGENLGKWMAGQKQMLRKGRLDSERCQKLVELGVEWLKME